MQTGNKIVERCVLRKDPNVKKSQNEKAKKYKSELCQKLVKAEINDRQTMQ